MATEMEVKEIVYDTEDEANKQRSNLQENCTKMNIYTQRQKVIDENSWNHNAKRD